MKSIKIIVLNKCKFYLKIFNNNDLLFDNYICNGDSICLEENNFYRINIYSDNTSFNTSIYVNDKTNYFIFNLNRRVTFLLQDDYYDMPLEKGDILLWQK